MSYGTVQAEKMTTESGYSLGAGNASSFKNRLINGGMVIDQRNGGSSVTITNILAATYTVDRWAAYGSVTSKFSFQRNAGSVTPPSGFVNYLGATSLSSYTVGASELYYVYQPIEGFNFADLAWGSAGAQPVTISFWVRSSLTGSFSGAITNGAYNRSYPFSYTINAANTWEYKTVTIPGDTIGTWATDNTTGANLFFNLGTGSNNLGTANAWAASGRTGVTGSQSIIATNGATFYITGVQLEVGTVATSFDWRPYSTELNLCLRYFFNLPTSGGGSTWLLAFYNSLARFPIPIPVPMRATPSVTLTGTAAGAIFTTVDDANYVNMTYSGASTGSPSLSNTFVALYGTVSVSTAGASVAYVQNNRTFSISAEL
jgi:hypothetical protein